MFHPITFQAIYVMGIRGPKFQDDTTFTSHVIGCQVHEIEKGIRPVFTDRVTFIFLVMLFSTWRNNKSNIALLFCKCSSSVQWIFIQSYNM